MVPDDSELNLTVRFWRGNALGELIRALPSVDGATPVAAGEGIFVQVGSLVPSGGGRFTLNLTFERPGPPSSNDAYGQRLELVPPYQFAEGNLHGATREPGEPAPDLPATLWWRFVAPGDGVLAVRADQAEFQIYFPITLSLYAGDRLASLTAVQPIGPFHYEVHAGREYAIRVASGEVASGLIGLSARFHSKSNDFFAGSEQVEGTNVVYHGNFTLATRQPDEPAGGPDNTVWMSWAAPTTGRAVYERASAWDFQSVEAYTGPTLATLTPLRTVHVLNGVMSFVALEGQIYHFRAAGGADDFQISIRLNPFVTPTNDTFATPQIMKGNSFAGDPKAIASATSEPMEPAHLGTISGRSLWWRWTATHSGVFGVEHASLVTNVVFALYQGSKVDALSLVAKGTNSLTADVVGDEVYHLAAAVTPETVGDLSIVSGLRSTVTPPELPLPGNLFQEWSWESTGIFGTRFWGMTLGVGGSVNERGGAEGVTWIRMATGSAVWQDIDTVPGREYLVRFACRHWGGVANVQLWANDEIVGGTHYENDETGYWNWPQIRFTAQSNSTRLKFENAQQVVELDAFSVADQALPPTIIKPPASISILRGGTATFAVSEAGTSPFTYQWYHHDAALAGRTQRTLTLTNISETDTGSYSVEVSNRLGRVRSAAAILTVLAPSDATILVQPSGDSLPAGAAHRFAVIAAGTPPLSYQWHHEGQVIVNATNRSLLLTDLQPINAGRYFVTVRNSASQVVSLPATLSILASVSGGGTVDFRNRPANPADPLNAPVRDVDQLTPLNGNSFQAQLYAGPTIDRLRPVGEPVPFRFGFTAGYFERRQLGLTDVPPGSNAFVQVRAWDRTVGESYEEARALGGRFGRSSIFSILAGGNELPPAPLIGLTSFNLQAGLPGFTVGRIQFRETLPDGALQWDLTGEPGFRYLIERSSSPGQPEWEPFLTLENVSGTVTFGVLPNPAAVNTLYRARILD